MSQARAELIVFAQALPRWLEQERSLLPALERLGVDASELKVLRADEQLLGILAEESRAPSADGSRRELERVMGWHERRLERLIDELPIRK